MIISFETWNRSGPPPRADFCVVGGGVCGLDLAVQLARKGRRVVVLESGLTGPDPRAQKLARHRIGGASLEVESDRNALSRVSAGLHDSPHRRVLGGTGTRWSSCWSLPGAAVFSARPWMGGSWPLAWMELDAAAREVARDFGVPEPVLGGEGGGRGLVDGGLECVPVFKPAAAIDFVRHHRTALEQNTNLLVVLGATAIELLPAPGGAGVAEVVVRGLEGATTRLAAAAFVLAAGAVDTTRLLLHSTRFGRRGPGNQQGLVGRGFVEHVRVRLGVFHPNRQAVSAGLLGEARWRKREIATRIRLGAERQRNLQLPDHALEFAVREQKGVLGRMLSGPEPCDAVLDLELRSDPANFVRLDAELDDAGLPVAEVTWRPTDADVQGARAVVAALQGVLDSNFGRLVVDDDAMDPANWCPRGHHTGTLRMGAVSGEGVVDCDLKVFGLGNLHVTGPAVLPAGGAGGPVMLALALGRRLARHLAG